MKALAATLVLGLIAGQVRADPSPAGARSPAVHPMTAAARQHYDRGAAAYQAGAYAQAIEAFERGRRLDPHPDFLYALAQVYRRQGDCQRAIALYQSFLATRPPDAEAERARANMERCPLAAPPAPGDGQPGASSSGASSSSASSSSAKSSGASLSGATSPGASSSAGASSVRAESASPPVGAPLAGSPPAPPSEVGEAWYTDVIGGALVGAGLISAGVGTTYLIAGNRAIDDARRAAVLVDLQRLAERGSHDRRIGALWLAGGGALVIGGVVRYALHRRTSSTRSIAVTPAPGGAVVSWGGPF